MCAISGKRRIDQSMNGEGIMATYNFNCPKCAQLIAADLAAAGQTLQCPQCQQTFIAPAPMAADASSPAAPSGTRKTLPLAVWSLVLGILGLGCCGIFIGIPAAICGHKA